LANVTSTEFLILGYLFDYWLLNGTPVYGNPITVTMDSDHVLWAYFAEPACAMKTLTNGSFYVPNTGTDLLKVAHHGSKMTTKDDFLAKVQPKAAIISVTQSAALAFSPYNINVNAVCPGVVPTPMWDQIDRDRSQLMGAKPGEALKTFVEKVPLLRAGSPEDVAGAVAFLCSSDADYITGQTLNVDGGFEMN
jgi:NAD(P)-dependent dehydrogenase (short-subunit alcohol dehydrogenase family)